MDRLRPPRRRKNRNAESSALDIKCPPPDSRGAIGAGLWIGYDHREGGRREMLNPRILTSSAPYKPDTAGKRASSATSSHAPMTARRKGVLSSPGSHPSATICGGTTIFLS